MDTAAICPRLAPADPPPAAWARLARAAAGAIVVVLIALQALGPFLHAHARGADGARSGLHLHWVAAAPAAVDPGPALEQWSLTPDEGAAIFLTTEYRRDRDPAACGLLAAPAAVVDSPGVSPAQPASRAAPACASLPPRTLAHLSPPTHAPPPG